MSPEPPIDVQVPNGPADAANPNATAAEVFWLEGQHSTQLKLYGFMKADAPKGRGSFSSNAGSIILGLLYMMQLGSVISRFPALLYRSTHTPPPDGTI